MGRPIKPSLVGKPTDYTDGRRVIVFNNAWIPGASAVSTKPVYIIKQTGATRYLVSDGDTTGQVYLSDTVTEAGQGNIRVVYGDNPSYFFHASKVLLHVASTYQDKVLAWTLGGTNAISSMTADEYTAALAAATTPATPTTPTTPTTGTGTTTPTTGTGTTTTTPTTGESGDTGTTGTNTSSDTTGAGSVGD